MSLLSSASHRRLNQLTGEWVLVSPHRTSRPWQGQVEKVRDADRPRYDPTCYLCPGNQRANSERNPPYTGVFAFDNDFAALTPQAPAKEFARDGLLIAEGEPGRCRVLCFSPRHDLTLSRMTVAEIIPVVEAWRDETMRLGALDMINYVQIFENRGAAMGASNPHPHCQIWATHSIPNEALKESQRQAAYLAQNGSCLLCDYLALEEKLAERIVCRNEHFVALVPFWAIWPFETMVLPTRHIGSFVDLSGEEAGALADILRRLIIRYDNLFETDFPYSMGFHQRPTDGAPHANWHFHAHFYPPLLRSATVRKFMVGFEMLGEPQRDITPETAAARLREVSETHYLDKATR
ncbi:MAG: UDP-glucose--hexose-1-phosphate uridylyltransferase [Alphaproteobacteria bacterium]|nr:UDP-glucose--hexose-1-phosphate uridylyltransferase [Alphaproteobacteria bacterium]MBM3624026.1 UDP-glucose--hexose-1-phosphate uridylyltransferase [Alphaproteobacteria bacterium]MBM3642148.1 UDP-glucose--hexose-1-phosphate uridylyltransferase [Alphaproteobacteria bacterium]